MYRYQCIYYYSTFPKEKLKSLPIIRFLDLKNMYLKKTPKRFISIYRGHSNSFPSSCENNTNIPKLELKSTRIEHDNDLDLPREITPKSH